MWTEDSWSDKAYAVLKTSTSTFAQDKDLCEEISGKLPEPRGTEDHDFLTNLHSHAFWLGMTHNQGEGHWRWLSDRSNVTWFHRSFVQVNTTRQSGDTGDLCVLVVRDVSNHERPVWSVKDCSRANFSEITTFPRNLICEGSQREFDFIL